MERRNLLGEILVDQGAITLHQLRMGLDQQHHGGGKLGLALVQLGYVDESVLARALSRQLGVPFVEINGREIGNELLRLVPERLLRQRRVVPLALLAESRRGPLVVATSDPLDVEALGAVALASGKKIRPVLATQPDIDRALSRYPDQGRPVGPGATHRALAALPGLRRH